MRGLATHVHWIEKTLDEFWEQSGYAALWFMTGSPRMPRTPGEFTYAWNDYIGRYYRPLVDSFARLVHASFERDLPTEFWSATYERLMELRELDKKDRRSLFSNRKKLNTETKTDEKRDVPKAEAPAEAEADAEADQEAQAEDEAEDEAEAEAEDEAEDEAEAEAEAEAEEETDEEDTRENELVGGAEEVTEYIVGDSSWGE